MKFKYFLKLIVLTLFSMNIAFCSSSDTKKPAEPEPEVVTEDVKPAGKDRSFDFNILDEINITLKEYRYPDGVRRRGFTYKKADVSKEDFNLWAKENINYIKEAFDRLPEGYVLQVKGHADSTGPEEAEGDKKGNIYYSQIRAEAVKEALVTRGIAQNRISTSAVGSSMPVSGYNEDDAINRRVTFQVVKSQQ